MKDSLSNTNPSRGVLIIAVGSRSYMNMACNLAVSVRDVCDLPIALITNLHPPDAYFDQVIIPNPEHMYRYVTHSGGQGLEPGWLKLNLDQYTPYDETVYVDADSVFLSAPDFAFSAPFTAPVLSWIPRTYEGRHNHMIWARIPDIRDHIAGDLPAINSSLLMFTPDAKPIFERARELFPKIKPSRKWGNGRPDELYFNIAASNFAGMFAETKLLRPAWEKKTDPRPILTLAGSEVQMRKYWRDMYRMRIKELSKTNRTFQVNWGEKFVTK